MEDSNGRAGRRRLNQAKTAKLKPKLIGKTNQAEEVSTGMVVLQSMFSRVVLTKYEIQWTERIGLDLPATGTAAQLSQQANRCSETSASYLRIKKKDYEL